MMSLLRKLRKTQEELQEESSESTAHKTGEKLLDLYAQLADWGIEYMEKNPDEAKMIKICAIVASEYPLIMMAATENLLTGGVDRTLQMRQGMGEFQEKAVEGIKHYLNDSGYTKEEQVAYAHALAIPLTVILKGKAGKPRGGLKGEILNGFKEFKKVHQKIKAKQKATPKPNAKRLAPEPSAKKAEFPHKDKAQRTPNTQSPGGGDAPNPNTPNPAPQIPGQTFTITKTQFDQKKIHDTFGAFYRDKKTGNWVTKDLGGTRGHGGCRFKEYEKKGNELVHIRDRDEFGKIIDKHKGEVGETIPWKELRGTNW